MNPFTSLYGHPLGVFSFESIRSYHFRNKKLEAGAGFLQSEDLPYKHYEKENPSPN